MVVYLTFPFARNIEKTNPKSLAMHIMFAPPSTHGEQKEKKITLNLVSK